MNFRHVFTRGSAQRIMPNVSSTGFSSVDEQDIELERAEMEANAGYTDYVARISEEEFLAHTDVYRVDCRIVLFDIEDPLNIDPDGNFQEGKECWSGYLDEPEVADGVVTLHASGEGRRADRSVKHWMWADYGTARYQATDSKSDLNYESDEEIEVSVEPHGIEAAYPHKTEFKHPTGHTKLQADAAATDDKVDLGQAEGLKRGDTITIGGIVRTVANGYHNGDTTVKLTAPLGTAKAEGTDVTWSVPPENRWASSGAGYFPGVDLGAVRFDVEVPRGRDDHMHLEVFKATGPDGNKSVLADYALNKHRDDLFVDLGGNKDLVGFTFYRTDEDRNADHFLGRVANLKTYGPFTTAKTYATYKIVRDVGQELGWDVSGVEVTTTNGLPFMVMPGRARDVLDQQTAVEDMLWLLEGNGTPELKFRKWGRKTWLLASEDTDVKLVSLPQSEKLHVAYSMDKGFEDYVTLTASPNPLAGGIPREYPDVIFQGDRPPPLALAMSFGQPIIDELAQPRFAGQSTLAYVEDNAAPGVSVPISRIRPGDKAKHPFNRNRVLRISKVTLTGVGQVVLGYPDDVFMLKKALAMRTLLLNRNVGQVKATLSGLSLRKPVKATNISIHSKEIDRRGGRRHFHDHVRFTMPTEDVRGRAIFIREVVMHYRFRDEDGNLVRNDAGAVVIHKMIHKLKDLDDNPADLPNEFTIRRHPHPHKWTVEVALDVVSMQHKHSDFTDFTSGHKPPAWAPNGVQSHDVKLNEHGIWTKVRADDPTETDEAGRPLLDQTIAGFIYTRFKNGVQVDDPVISRKTSHYWRHEKPKASDVFLITAQPVDHYGFLGPLSQVTISRGDPASPSSPWVAFHQGKIKSRVTVSGSYNLDAYTQSAIDSIRVRMWNGVEEQEHTIKVPRDASGVFNYSTTFRGIEDWEYLEFTAKAHAKNRHESAYSAPTIVVAGVSSKIDADNIGNDAVGEMQLHPNAIRNRHTIRAARFVTSLTDSGARIAIVDPADGSNDRINIYDGAGTRVGSIRGVSGDVFIDGGVRFDDRLRLDGALWISENVVTPVANHACIFKDPGSKQAKIRWSDGTTDIIKFV